MPARSQLPGIEDPLQPRPPPFFVLVVAVSASPASPSPPSASWCAAAPPGPLQYPSPALCCRRAVDRRPPPRLPIAGHLPVDNNGWRRTYRSTAAVRF